MLTYICKLIYILQGIPVAELGNYINIETALNKTGLEVPMWKFGKNMVKIRLVPLKNKTTIPIKELLLPNFLNQFEHLEYERQNYILLNRCKCFRHQQKNTLFLSSSTTTIIASAAASPFSYSITTLT